MERSHAFKRSSKRTDKPCSWCQKPFFPTSDIYRCANGCRYSRVHLDCLQIAIAASTCTPPGKDKSKRRSTPALSSSSVVPPSSSSASSSSGAGSLTISGSSQSIGRRQSIVRNALPAAWRATNTSTTFDPRIRLVTTHSLNAAVRASDAVLSSPTAASPASKEVQALQAQIDQRNKIILQAKSAMSESKESSPIYKSALAAMEQARAELTSLTEKLKFQQELSTLSSGTQQQPSNPLLDAFASTSTTAGGTHADKLQTKMENAFIDAAALSESASYAREREEAANEHFRRTLKEQRSIREKRLQVWNSIRSRLDQLIAAEEDVILKEEELLHDMGNVTRWLQTCDLSLENELIEPLAMQYSRVIRTRGAQANAPFNYSREGLSVRPPTLAPLPPIEAAKQAASSQRASSSSSMVTAATTTAVEWDSEPAEMTVSAPPSDDESDTPSGSMSSTCESDSGGSSSMTTPSGAPGKSSGSARMSRGRTGTISSSPATFVDASNEVLHSLCSVLSAYRSLFDYRENLFDKYASTASNDVEQTTEMMLELLQRLENETRQCTHSLSTVTRLHERVSECKNDMAALHELIHEQRLLRSDGLSRTAGKLLRKLREESASLLADVRPGLGAGEIELDGGDIRAVSTDKLVELLTSPEPLNSVLFQKTFLMTFRYYMSAPQLLEKLVMRYCISPDPSRLDVTEFCSNEQRPTRLRVLVVLQFWIANYYDIDFVEPKHRDLLQAFINNIVSRTGHHAQGKEMLLLLEARAKQVHLHQQSRTPRGAATEHDPHAVVRYAEEDSIVLLSPRSSGSSASSASSSCSSSSSSSSLSSAISAAITKNPSATAAAAGTAGGASAGTTTTINTTPMPSLNITAVPPLSAENFSVLEHSPFEIAVQLTLLEAKLFGALRWHEFVQQRWSKRDKNTLAPGIVAFTTHFNRVGGWVVWQVVSEKQLERRAAILRRLVVIAMHLYRLNNYNGLFEILAGLDNTPVARLRRSWKAVGYPLFQIKEQLRQLMSDNYTLYRRDLRVAELPCVPHIGMFLKDLTFLEDGNPTVHANGLVNFFKFRRISEVISGLLQFQNTPYDPETMVPNDTMQHVLSTLPTFEEADAYSRSQQLESSADVKSEERFRYSPPAAPEEMLQLVRALRTHSLLLKEEILALEAAAAAAAAVESDAAAAASQHAPCESETNSTEVVFDGACDSGDDDEIDTEDDAAESDFLEEVVLAMRNPHGGLDIRARRHKLTKHKECFVGSEAVTWMLDNLALGSRDEAVALGQQLLSKNYIQHVTDEYDFRDKPLLYRFRNRNAMIQ